MFKQLEKVVCTDLNIDTSGSFGVSIIDPTNTYVISLYVHPKYIANTHTYKPTMEKTYLMTGKIGSRLLLQGTGTTSDSSNCCYDNTGTDRYATTCSTYVDSMPDCEDESKTRGYCSWDYDDSNCPFDADALDTGDVNCCTNIRLDDARDNWEEYCNSFNEDEFGCYERDSICQWNCS